jgi:hypothetical protein
MKFYISSNRSRKILGKYLKIRNDNFLSCPFQFTNEGHAATTQQETTLQYSGMYVNTVILVGNEPILPNSTLQDNHNLHPLIFNQRILSPGQTDLLLCTEAP